MSNQEKRVGNSNNALVQKSIKWAELDLSNEVKSQLYLLSQNIHQKKVPLETSVSKDVMNIVLNGEEGMTLGWWAESSLKLSAHIYCEHQDLYRLQGSLQIDLGHSCVRCLKKLELEFEIDYDIRLIPGDSDILGTLTFDLDPGNMKEKMSLEDFEESMLMENDEDFINFARGKINLLQILREQIFIELPSHPACESTEFSLSGPCDSDQSRRSEDEASAWVASKWSGLEALRDKLKN